MEKSMGFQCFLPSNIGMKHDETFFQPMGFHTLRNQWIPLISQWIDTLLSVQQLEGRASACNLSLKDSYISISYSPIRFPNLQGLS